MPGKRHGSFHLQEHGRHRWHHDPEEGSFDRGRHHGHGGRHERGGHPRGQGRHGLHSGRKLSASDLQLILLAQLADKSAHGYELIKSLEDHSHGLFVPSPGAIYPALTYLEEAGFASVEMEGTRKCYSLTEAGRSHYEQNREAAARILSDMERIGAQMAQARQVVESGQISEGRKDEAASEELETARHELRRAQRKEGPYTAEETRRVAEILNRAAADIRHLLAASQLS